MYTAGSFTQARKINQYLLNDLNTSGPEQLIMKVYDFAILNCNKKNMIKTNEALQVLINTLNFEESAAKEISIGLFRLYTYCQDQMRKQKYSEVLKILTELRNSWREALQNK